MIRKPMVSDSRKPPAAHHETDRSYPRGRAAGAVARGRWTYRMHAGSLPASIRDVESRQDSRRMYRVPVSWIAFQRRGALHGHSRQWMRRAGSAWIRPRATFGSRGARRHLVLVWHAGAGRRDSLDQRNCRAGRQHVLVSLRHHGPASANRRERVRLPPFPLGSSMDDSGRGAASGRFQGRAERRPDRIRRCTSPREAGAAEAGCTEFRREVPFSRGRLDQVRRHRYRVCVHADRRAQIMDLDALHARQTSQLTSAARRSRCYWRLVDYSIFHFQDIHVLRSQVDPAGDISKFHLYEADRAIGLFFGMLKRATHEAEPHKDGGAGRTI